MFNSCRSDQLNTVNTQVGELAYFLFMLSYPLGDPVRYYRVDKLRERMREVDRLLGLSFFSIIISSGALRSDSYYQFWCL